MNMHMHSILFSFKDYVQLKVKYVLQNCAACPATCSEPSLICTEKCTPGCGCPAGELINTLNNKCIRPKECPHTPLPSKCAVS